MSKLAEILAHKRLEVEEAKRRVAPDRLRERAERMAPAPRGFARALRAAPTPRVVAEIKRRSPSRGVIREDFDAVAIAHAYEDAGAAALSVLTDAKYFDGSLAILEAVRAAVSLPILRKDFVVDAYQLDEARVAGADAVLLIVAALEPEPLAALHERSRALGLDALVEVHDEAELDVAKGLGAELIGVNNRDLKRMVTDLAVTERLAPLVPASALLVAESGLRTHADLARLARCGAGAFLVGESLMSQPDVGRALRTLRGEV